MEKLLVRIKTLTRLFNWRINRAKMVQSCASMNFAYYEHHREEDIAASLPKMAFNLARLRLALLGKLGWRGLSSFDQQWALLKDLFRGLFLLPFYGTKLRESRLVRMLISSRQLGSHATTLVLVPD